MTSSPPTDRPWYMAGTESTGKYLVLCKSDRGRIGVRDLGNNRFRVRVEPAPGMSLPLSRNDGWKQPGNGGQQRYSTMAAKETLTAAVNAAIGALGGDLVWNTDARVKSYRDAYQAVPVVETPAAEAPALAAPPTESSVAEPPSSEAPVAEPDSDAALMAQLEAEAREARCKAATDLLAIAGVRTFTAKRLGQLVRKDLDEVAGALELEVPEGTTKVELAKLIANQLA